MGPCWPGMAGLTSCCSCLRPASLQVLGSRRSQPLEDWGASSKGVVIAVVVAPICAMVPGIIVPLLFCGTATVWKKVFPFSQ